MNKTTLVRKIVHDTAVGYGCECAWTDKESGLFGARIYNNKIKNGRSIKFPFWFAKETKETLQAVANAVKDKLTKEGIDAIVEAHMRSVEFDYIVVRYNE